MDSATETQTVISDMENIEGKYLIFVLSGEEYGVEILRVREIIGKLEITSVPQTPHYVKGVINLRGKVIPVIDLRLKFGMEEMEYTNETCIIVVEVHQTLIGVVVDTVSEVLFFNAEDIEPTPSLGEHADTAFILGMGKIKEEVKILLDIEKVLSGDDMMMSAAVEL